MLIITRDFPPYAGSGNVMRMLKFAKYLPQFGWQPVVVYKKGTRVDDETLLAQLPECVELHPLSAHSPRKRKERVKTRIRQGGQPLHRLIRDYIYRIVIYPAYCFYRAYLMAPDGALHWARQASGESLRLNLHSPVDCVLTSGPPFSTFRAGRILKKRTGLPWVLDFRDGWVGNPLYRSPKRWFVQQINRRLERRIVEEADCGLLVTPPLVSIYRRRYPEAAARMRYLPNGFDTEDMPRGAPSAVRDDLLRITYVGSAGGRRNPAPLLRAVQRYLQHGDAPAIRITFVGKVTGSISHWKKKLGDVLHVRGMVPHRDALQAMRDADLLLFMSHPSEGGKTVMSGKLYEYLFMRKPVFALSHACAATDLIQSLDAGYIAFPEDDRQIYACLEQIVQDWRKRQLKTVRDISALRPYAREQLAEQLAAILNDCVACA